MTYPGQRLFDVCAALLFVVLAAPFLLVFLVCAVVVERRLPFERRHLVGRKGAFHMLTFQLESERGKRLLARWTRDHPTRQEILQTLPGILAVLRGHLSLVGLPPRPTHPPVEVHAQTQDKKTGWLSLMLLAPPGYHSQTRNEFSEMYARKACLRLDLWILGQVCKQLGGPP